LGRTSQTAVRAAGQKGPRLLPPLESDGRSATFAVVAAVGRRVGVDAPPEAGLSIAGGRISAAGAGDLSNRVKRDWGLEMKIATSVLIPNFFDFVVCGQ
jgi:hypothetical protein